MTFDTSRPKCRVNRWTPILAAASFFAVAAGCSVSSSQQTLVGSPVATSSSADGWWLRSCAPDSIAVSAETIALVAEPVALDPTAPGTTRLGELTYAGGLLLESADSRFGGLSGLAVTDAGTLAAVSDDGHLFQFEVGLDPVSGMLAAVKCEALMQPLLDASGNPLEGKASADAEALYWANGHAFVSFERRHRIEGFDVGRCAGSARGVLLAELTPEALSGLGGKVGSNAGPEALAIAPDGSFIVGIEMLTRTGAAVSLARPGRPIDFGHTRLPVWDGLMLTDLAAFERPNGTDLLFSLHRGFDPIRGVRVAIAVTPLEASREGYTLGETLLLGRLARPLSVDNFEGLTVLPGKDDTIRLLILSDNNFSERQRTLLLAFDWQPTL